MSFDFFPVPAEHNLNEMEIVHMMDVNLIITKNILEILKKQGRKQAELADEIGVSKATMRKMLNGGCSINAVELKKIADCLNSSMDDLVIIPEAEVETDSIHALMGKAENEKARDALQTADKVSDFILRFINELVYSPKSGVAKSRIPFANEGCLYMVHPEIH